MECNYFRWAPMFAISCLCLDISDIVSVRMSLSGSAIWIVHTMHCPLGEQTYMKVVGGTGSVVDVMTLYGLCLVTDMCDWWQ